MKVENTDTVAGGSPGADQNKTVQAQGAGASTAEVPLRLIAIVPELLNLQS